MTAVRPGAAVWTGRYSKLVQNYSNPYNAETRIVYSTPRPGRISLKVYDAAGNEAACFVDANHAVGEYTITFSAHDVPSGMYLCCVWTESHSMVRKLIFAR